ncbi:MAG: F0F1 ATP synthase subunit epsilon [Gammaproteobacteria bacterium]|nr:F0F1 ATP synthase subunit epsilon [Gammaproteobacteria bacterium]MDE0450954.1 F0F1 ATP synthase subunit epsilon [Gammaproteobacteria bacterium]
MAATMQCDIVSAEKEIYSGRVTMVIATGTIGELGILPGHAPLLTGIKPGPVTLRFEDGEEDVFFASGGFLEVQPGIVTVLADTALRADDIDEASALESRERAERDLSEQASDFDFSLATAQLADAAGRQRTLEELRKRRR